MWVYGSCRPVGADRLSGLAAHVEIGVTDRAAHGALAGLRTYPHAHYFSSRGLGFPVVDRLSRLRGHPARSARSPLEETPEEGDEEAEEEG